MVMQRGNGTSGMDRSRDGDSSNMMIIVKESSLVTVAAKENEIAMAKILY